MKPSIFPNWAIDQPDVECDDEGEAECDEVATDDRAKPAGPIERTFHRIATVRRQQGISPRNVARQLNVDIATVRQQEEESADLPLSVLYQWQRVLDVPISELLVDTDGPLSPPVLERARMVKVMKTVAAIGEKARTPAVKRLVEMLFDQLLEIMPELRDVAPWHSIGQRRTLEEYGRAVERQMPDELFRRNGR